jgi:hypothetical protein
MQRFVGHPSHYQRLPNGENKCKNLPIFVDSLTITGYRVDMTTNERIQRANKIAKHINDHGSIAQPDFKPEYTAKVWNKGETVRIYLSNGGKGAGNLTVEADGTIGEQYATPGRFGWELIEAAKKEVGL